MLRYRRPPETGGSTQPGKRGVLSFLTNIGELRDALLVGAGIVYILGYVTWSISAYSLGLGLLPALEAQYFMAGIAPAVILGIVLLLLFNITFIDSFLRELFEPKKAILKSTFFCIGLLCLAGIALGGPIFAIAPYLPYEWTQFLHLEWRQSDDLILKVISSLVLVAASIPAYYTVPHVIKLLSEKVTKSIADSTPLEIENASSSSSFIRNVESYFVAFFDHYPKAHVIYLSLSASLIGIGVYAAYFERLPQEFGGIGKRCAYFDIAYDQVSPTTLDALSEESPFVEQSAPKASNFAELGQLVPLRANTEKPKVFRSRAVDVVFKASSVIVVDVEGQRFELPPSVLRAITWCDA